MLAHAIIHKGISNLHDIQQAVHGKPNLQAALHFLEAMSSHDLQTLLDVFDEKAMYTMLPMSLKNAPFGKDKLPEVSAKVWGGVKNFKIIPVSPPFEASEDRVIMHAQIDPDAHATTPGGTAPYVNEYMYIIKFVQKNGKPLIIDIVEYMDSLGVATWAKALTAEKAHEEQAKAAGDAPTPADASG